MNNRKDIFSKILSASEAAEKAKAWQKNSKTIVFTNGCFDIIHRGHVEYLAAAADYGDKLIVGLNTDSSVTRLKGKGRPVNDEESRAIVLASLKVVDVVVFFSEDTPYRLISEIQPDVLVKGNDYKAEEIVGYDIVTQRGGCVLTIDLVEGFSTTNIINKSKHGEEK